MEQQDRLVEMIRLYEVEKLTYAQIGECFGISRQRVHQVFSQAGVERRPTKNSVRFERDLLFRLYIEEKNSIAKVAAKLDVSPYTINKELIRNGIKVRPPKHRMIYLDRDELHRLYVVDGLFQRQVAAKLGVGHNTVEREIKRHGIKFRHPPGIQLPKEFDPKKLRSLYVDKKQSTAEIAEKFGVSKKTVLNYLERQGIERRNAVKRS